MCREKNYRGNWGGNMGKNNQNALYTCITQKITKLIENARLRKSKVHKCLLKI